MFVQVFDVKIFRIYLAVRLDPLGPWLVVEMVVPVETLVSLHRLLKVKLELGVLGLKAYRNSIADLRGHGKMRPSLQDLVSLVLELVLAALIKLLHLLPDHVRV